MATDRIAAQLKSDLMRDFGLTDVQAAGVVGNLMHESGGFQQLQERNPSVKGSDGGYGYAQWTGPRRDKFEQYAKDRGLEPGSYEANYGYLKYELANDPYERRQFNTVKKAQTAEEAARLVSENFLRPGKPNLAERTRLAQEAMGYAPVPPSDIPSAVATQLDVARPAPTPATQSPDMRLMRNPMMSTTAERASQFSGDPGTPAQGQVVATIPSVPSGPQFSASDRVRGTTPMNMLTSNSRAPSGLIQPGNLDLNARKVYYGGNGDYRTENSMSIGTDRGEALIPTVVNGKQLEDQAAIDHYLRTGENLGYFNSPQSADTYAENLHLRQEQRYAPRQQNSASDMVRGSNGYQTIASIPSIPQPQQVSASDLTRGRSGISTVASIPSVPQQPTISTSDMARGNNAWQTIASIPSSPIGQPPATRSVQSAPITPQRPMSYAGQDRASPTIQLPSLPALPPLQGFDNPNKGQERLVANAFPAAPGGDATALTPLSAFAPMPQLPAFPSITAGMPQVMPPMPRQRPQMQAQSMPTMPRGRPLMATPIYAGQAQAMSPLRITVNGGTVQQQAPQQEARSGIDGVLQNIFSRPRADANDRRYDPESGQWR